jgi:pimeloyl-ACP methyl ester carboxylesterase
MKDSLPAEKHQPKQRRRGTTTARYALRNLWTALLLTMAAPSLGSSWHNCTPTTDNEENSFLFCPNRATCCPMGCITGSPHAPANMTGECCHDDIHTGCGQGYQCAHDENVSYCRLVTPVNEESPNRLPRYQLCHLSPSARPPPLYGWTLQTTTENAPPLAYYTTAHGPLDAGDASTLNQFANIRTIVVVIHGSARNADDYLCCMQRAVPEEQQNTTLVVAPWFPAPGDDDDDGASYLRWSDKGPISHTWRYGANSLETNISSYAVLDDLVLHWQADRVRFPRLRRILVAGHSAGGQYAQRWALLTPVVVAPARALVRVVVANPRSFAYLDPRRFLSNGTFGIPNHTDCPEYDDWEWGLSTYQSPPLLTVPYKDKAIASAGGVAAVVDRYRTRDVVYLSGGLDTFPQDDNCRAQLQGRHRRERSALFVASLAQVYGRPVHHRLVGHGIPHDHCLLFQSSEGRQALFGD